MTRFGLMLASAGLAMAVAIPTAPVEAASGVPTRTFDFTYQVRIPANPDPATTTHVWLPLPQPDGYQDIRNLHIESPVIYTDGHDSEYGNPLAMFTPTAQQSASGFDINLRFTATRREHRVLLNSTNLKYASLPASSDPQLQRYLEPDRLVPLGGVIAELAKEHTAGDKTTIQKARHIYDYVVATMRYDKSGDGWGRGDAIWACASKRGNCTDFHSLLIGMMRSSGIPVRFEIGFSIPEGTSEGDILGYHCWAEFYLDGVGWVPVDASEAWKNPSRRDYFFGAHDASRVLFTYGRDLRLSADQVGDPLNYFFYPYGETNGKSIANLEKHFSFREVSDKE